MMLANGQLQLAGGVRVRVDRAALRQGLALEHAADGRLRVTPLACALGHVESAARPRLHDTLRGRSLSP